MEKTDCIVIGAGVVGLAVAREMSLDGRDVLVLEAELGIGRHTSARNSEVIHAGIYYPADSEKAALCLPGRDLLYAYCQERGISNRRCGKLIVATKSIQIDPLKQIFSAGIKNGVTDLEYYSKAQVLERSPALNAVAGIWSPSSGTIDSHQLMMSFAGDIENAGGLISLNSEVLRIAPESGGLRVDVNTSPAMSLLANTVINCAGLAAPDVAKKTDRLTSTAIPQVEYAKGSYFSYSGATPFDCLVYPIPTPGGLGIHLTLDQAGRARFGPDVEWVDEVNYSVAETAKEKFFHSVQDYWPDVDINRMHADYAGIRAKTMPNGKAYHDFIFSGPEAHGIAGLINLFGIESPGLTSCLAIAKRVAKMV